MTKAYDMSVALRDAIDGINRHPCLEVQSVEERDSGEVHVVVKACIPLPSRCQAGISGTGVKSEELVRMVFRKGYPDEGPEFYLRSDFPTDLPHIYPHKNGDPVPPCIFQGSVNDLLHTEGLAAVLDQLVSWLERAASGLLMNLQQGWEPVRRRFQNVAIEFDPVELVKSLPNDGSLLRYSARFWTVGEQTHLRIDSSPTQPDVFTQERLTLREGKSGTQGTTQVLILSAPSQQGERPIFEKYQAEVAYDLPSLNATLEALGCPKDTLNSQLASFCTQSNLAVQTSKAQWPWDGDFFVGVILAARRPVSLIGTERDIELIPYVVRVKKRTTAPNIEGAEVLPALNLQPVGPSLLTRTSGIPETATERKLVFLGCGSLGSKVSLHLARSGFGKQTIIDHETLLPHNLARHAAVDLQFAYKAYQQLAMLGSLGHTKASALTTDILPLLRDKALGSEVLNTDPCLVIDTTASPQVESALVISPTLEHESPRLVRAMMFNKGQLALVLLEGTGRTPRCDDLLAQIFEACRHDAELRHAMGGDSIDLHDIVIGENCRSVTMQMPDSRVSQCAADVAQLLEGWVSGGIPSEGKISYGIRHADGLTTTWRQVSEDAVEVLHSSGEERWTVRISSSTSKLIREDSAQHQTVETGGALVGHVDLLNHTIVITGTLEAPADSTRSPTKFNLGTMGLMKKVRDVMSDSLGYLHIAGTWHSHPMGGSHSEVDLQTLKEMAEEVPGMPFVSLVVTPDSVLCTVHSA